MGNAEGRDSGRFALLLSVTPPTHPQSRSVGETKKEKSDPDAYFCRFFADLLLTLEIKGFRSRRLSQETAANRGLSETDFYTPPVLGGAALFAIFSASGV